MPTTADCSAAFLSQLGKLRLIPPESLAELSRLYPGGGPDPRVLARDLLGRGWLTPYQINQLFAGHGEELVLGTYVLLERLGEGGMARVFKARHQRLDRLVALKIVRPDLVKNAEAVRRFRREVRAVAQMSHPNIVLALDADEVHGTHFLVMEYVEGTDLSRLVKREGRLEVPRACDYVRQVALGLQHAHEGGLVHRDIKPSNLLVTNAPRREEEEEKGTEADHPWGLVKILDMGLARCLREEPGENTAVTRAGELIGTPEFLAPEQAANPHAADIRADLYSLGCTFYYLLTGQPPFPGGTSIQKLFQHRLEEARPVEELRPEVPAELGDVIRRLLAKQPEDRYPTPRHLADALRPWADPSGAAATLRRSVPVPSLTVPAPPAAGPPTETLSALTPPPAGPARRRSLWWPTALSGGAFLACLAGFFFLLWRPAAAPEKRGAETTESKSRSALHALMARADNPQADLAQLRQELVAFRAQHAGTEVGRAAAELVAGFPSPLDRLDPRSVPPEARFGGHPGGDLVLVQGDNRLHHGMQVFAVALSPDGKTAVSGGENRQVCFWDVESGRRAACWDGAAGPVGAVAFAPDGQTAAWASHDGTVRLLDVRQKKERGVLRHPTGVRSLAFSGDGKYLVTGANWMHGKPGGAVRLWDVGPKKELLNLEGFHGNALAVALSPNGQLLASGGEDKVIHLWEVADKKEVGKLEGHHDTIRALLFAPDGQTLVSASHDKTLRVWDVGQRKERTGAHDFGHHVTALAAVPNGPLVVAALSDGTLRLWDVAANQEKGMLCGHHGWVHAVAVSADGRLAVSGGQDGHVRRWDLAKKEEVRIKRSHEGFTTLALAPDDQTLATGHFGGRIRLWDLPAGKSGSVLEKHQHGVAALAFSPDGKLLASGGWDHVAVVWDVAKGTDRHVLRGHRGPVTAVAFHPAGALLATGSHDATARLWDPATGREVSSMTGHAQGVSAVALSPDGKVLLTGSGDRTLKAWDAASGRENKSLGEFAGEALAAAPEKYLAGGTGTAAVRLWDVTGPRPVEGKLLAGTPLHWVKALAFAPDGRALVAAGNDGTVVFWNTQSGREVRRWTLPGGVQALAYAGDGRHLVFLLADGTFVVFRLAPPPERRPPGTG